MKKVSLIKVFIASPGDVSSQRDEIEAIINDWNMHHTDDKEVVLLPIRWENNAVSSYRQNESGQAVINEQLVLSSDLLIALFGNKIGTKTASGKSGTVEEINAFYEKNQSGVGVFFVDDQNVPHNLMQERVIVDMYKDHLSKTNQGLYQKYSKRNIQFFINKNVQELMDKAGIGSKTKETYNLFDDIEFDDDERLLIIYSVEEQSINFGDRWLAEDTIDAIKRWEEKNNIRNYLSDRYSNALDKLKIKGLIVPKEFTKEGNPRLFSYTQGSYEKLKRVVQKDPNSIQDIKQSFKKITKDYDSIDLPF